MKWKRQNEYHAISNAGYTVCRAGRIPMVLKFMAYHGKKIIGCEGTFRLAADLCDEHFLENNETMDGDAI